MTKVILMAWTILVGSVAVANASDVVYVPAGCVVGPRTTEVIVRQCGGDLTCAAAKIKLVCDVKVGAK